MSILSDVLAELFGMFLSDARLTAAILIVVAATAALIDLAGVSPLIGCAVLLAGSLLVVVGAVVWAARRARAGRAAARS